MTNEQKTIIAQAEFIASLQGDVSRLESSRDYAQSQYNRECNKLVWAEKELKEAQVKNLDLEFKPEDTQKQLKEANESSDGLTQDVIQSEKNIADLREECDRLTDSNKALRLALELKQLNGPDVSELRKEIRQLQDKNDELTRMCAPDPDIPERHVKTADEIRKMCVESSLCSDCGNDGKNGVDGSRGCRFSLNHMLPIEWRTRDIDAIDAIIEFATAPEETE